MVKTRFLKIRKIWWNGLFLTLMVIFVSFGHVNWICPSCPQKPGLTFLAYIFLKVSTLHRCRTAKDISCLLHYETSMGGCQDIHHPKTCWNKSECSSPMLHVPVAPLLHIRHRHLFVCLSGLSGLGPIKLISQLSCQVTT